MGLPGEGAEQGDTLSVKVAVNVRPLISQERIEGCQECVRVVPGEPQVQLSDRAAFTFDHVYGSTGTPLGNLFQESIFPLVEGLFQGYNATVLAYGQTGSGKTYTMGTAYTVGGNTTGVIPSVMDAIFKKVNDLKEMSDVQLRVSFIEIHKEEIRDLLDLASPSMSGSTERSHSFGGKETVPKGIPGKAPIAVRETANGGIQLAGVTETDVRTIEEMAACLEQGSLCRATGSTSMNTQSSRSHAIFTVTVEQRRKWKAPDAGSMQADDGAEDYLCAKLHLVDLAGSERAKRTKADGQRLQEGIHINKGLLALGNVISALGDEKKKKENCHVPYRDSKLTRLLQDSLGGNSRTVMIACISPADVNMDETLNTLKYANRARNIQNKPTINRDPTAAEMARLKQQVQLLQAELSCSRSTGDLEENQMLRRRILAMERQLVVAEDTARAESSKAMSFQAENARLMLKLEAVRSGGSPDEVDNEKVSYVEGLLAKIQELESHVEDARRGTSFVEGRETLTSAKDEGPPGSFSMSSSFMMQLPLPMSEEEPGEMEEVAKTKELEHTLAQSRLDTELQELNRMLAQKENEMQNLAVLDQKALALKAHYERKMTEMEEEKRAAEKERDHLLTLLHQTAALNDEESEKKKASAKDRIAKLEHELEELKKKQMGQQQYIRASKRSEEQAKRLQEEILKMKQQKVQLQKKMSHEMEQFNSWKQSHEKQLLQLRKEGRHAAYEMHKLQALHQRQSKVLQRKTEEEANARKQLKELKDLLSARKQPPPRESITSSSGTIQSSHNSAGGGTAQQSEQQREWLEREVEMVVKVYNARRALDKAVARRAALGRELENEKQTCSEAQKKQQQVANGVADGWETGPMPFSPRKSNQRIINLQVEMQIISKTIQDLQQHVLEAEERQRKEFGANGVGRWQHIRSLPDARNILRLAFSQATAARCQLKDTEEEIAKKAEELDEALEMARKLERKLIQSEEALADQRKKSETEKKYVAKKSEEAAVALDTAMKVGTKEGLKLGMEHLKERDGRARQEIKADTPGWSTTEKENGKEALRSGMEQVGKTLRSRAGKVGSSETPIDLSDSDPEDDAESHSDEDPGDPEWTEDSRTPARGLRARRPSTADPQFRAARTKSRPPSRLGDISIARTAEEPTSSSGSAGPGESGPSYGKSPVLAWGAPEECANQAQSSTPDGCQCVGKCKRCPCQKNGRFCDDQCRCRDSRCENRAGKAKAVDQVEIGADPMAEALAVQMDLTSAMNAIQTTQDSVTSEEREKAQKTFATVGAKLEQAMAKGVSKGGPLDGVRRSPLNPLDKNTDAAVNMLQEAAKIRPATSSSLQPGNGMAGLSTLTNVAHPERLMSRNTVAGSAIAATAHAIESSATASIPASTTPTGVSPRTPTPTVRRNSFWPGYGNSASTRERDYPGVRGAEMTTKDAAVSTAAKLQKFGDLISRQNSRGIIMSQNGSVSRDAATSVADSVQGRPRVMHEVSEAPAYSSFRSRSVRDPAGPSETGGVHPDAVSQRRGMGFNYDSKSTSRSVIRNTVGDISDLRIANSMRGGNERTEKENTGR